MTIVFNLLFCCIIVVVFGGGLSSNHTAKNAAMSEIKTILRRTLENCKSFNQYCDNETMTILFTDKLVDITSIQYYIFQDSLIYDCIEYKDIIQIENLLDSLLKEDLKKEG